MSRIDAIDALRRDQHASPRLGASGLAAPHDQEEAESQRCEDCCTRIVPRSRILHVVSSSAIRSRHLSSLLAS